MPEQAQDAAATFNPLRSKLIRVAYRMLGSVADAEDVVQEAFIRWMEADRAAVRVPEAFLRRTVTRLCLDQLKSARHRRETYIGPWLPDPIVEEDEPDDVTLPLMLALDDFGEVAATLQREEAACRQLASRARTRIREGRPRFQVEKQHGLELAEAFFKASRNGEMGVLRAMLSADVSLHADGGGKRSAARVPVHGLDAVIKLHEALAVLFARKRWQLVRVGFINGLPGFVTRESDGELQTTALEIENGQVAAIYVMRNPDKLRHLH
jgi:RNA polymerase sigma-70 factor (ECF subfamily)